MLCVSSQPSTQLFYNVLIFKCGSEVNNSLLVSLVSLRSFSGRATGSARSACLSLPCLTEQSRVSPRAKSASLTSSVSSSFGPLHMNYRCHVLKAKGALLKVFESSSSSSYLTCTTYLQADARPTMPAPTPPLVLLRSDPPVSDLQPGLPWQQASAHVRHAQLQVLGARGLSEMIGWLSGEYQFGGGWGRGAGQICRGGGR